MVSMVIAPLSQLVNVPQSILPDYCFDSHVDQVAVTVSPRRRVSATMCRAGAIDSLPSLSYSSSSGLEWKDSELTLQGTCPRM